MTDTKILIVLTMAAVIASFAFCYLTKVSSQRYRTHGVLNIEKHYNDSQNTK